MATWFKQGVCGELNRGAAEGLRKESALYASKKKELYITSLREGTHSPASKHPQGDAWDHRAEGVSISDIKLALGDEFDVIAEADHIHVEWDPK